MKKLIIIFSLSSCVGGGKTNQQENMANGFQSESISLVCGSE